MFQKYILFNEKQNQFLNSEKVFDCVARGFLIEVISKFICDHLKIDYNCKN